ncbi:MAG: FG-GAP-like repeat-containing protein [Polyangiales bacterium]
MASRASLLSIGSLVVLAACRYPATVVLINTDSNVSASRVDLLDLRVVRGAASVASVRAAPRTVLDPPMGSAQFANSFALVPPEGGDRAGTLTFLATLRVRAEGDSPAAFIERVHRVSMIERVRQQGRVFFDLRCADRAEGCTSVSSEECTVSVRCLELESTCGDQGECVPIELPLSPTDAGADASSPADVTITRADVVLRRDGGVDASDASVGMDAASDARAEGGTDASGDVTSLPLARPLAPLNGGFVGTSRPQLRWVSQPGSNQIELCRDRAMTAACVAPQVTAASSLTLSTLPSGGAWFWRVTSTPTGMSAGAPSAVWQFRVARTAAPLMQSTSHSVELDFNGDGFSDLAVGQPGSSPPRVYVFAGNSTGLAATPSWTLNGPVGSNFGSAVSSAGDINGDGYTDLLVGASDAAFSGRAAAGTVSIFLGGAVISTTASQTLGGASALEGMGDVVSPAGDVNGDGYADVIASSSRANSARGIVRVFYGSASGLLTTAARTYAGAAADDRFGAALAFVGDVNGDSFSDIAVGAPFADVGTTNNGQASLFLGASTGVSATPSQTYAGASANGQFAWSIAGAEVDGNGLTDFLIAAPLASPGSRAEAGIVQLYRGNDPPPTNFSRTYEGVEPGDHFGWVARGADTNGDGFADVIVGAPMGSWPGGRNVGTVAAFHMLTTADRTVGTRNRSSEFGTVLSAGGDFNNDTYFDVAVGAPATTGAQMAAGAVTVYLGSATGMAATASVTLTGSNANGRLGAALSSGH